MERSARLTAADELEAALRLFFHVASGRSRKRARPQPVEVSPSPGDAVEVHLRRIKQVLRDADAGEQAALVQRVLAVVVTQLSARKVDAVVLERVR
jgi:hypothetical protein